MKIRRFLLTLVLCVIVRVKRIDLPRDESQSHAFWSVVREAFGMCLLWLRASLGVPEESTKRTVCLNWPQAVTSL